MELSKTMCKSGSNSVNQSNQSTGSQCSMGFLTDTGVCRSKLQNKTRASALVVEYSLPGMDLPSALQQYRHDYQHELT
jgi:hypothetical protein